MKFLISFFCLFIYSANAADLKVIKKTNDETLNKIQTEFDKLSPKNKSKKFKIINRKQGEKSLLIIKKLAQLNFEINEFFSRSVQVEELKFSNEILVALSDLFKTSYDSNEERIETQSLSAFEGFLVDHLSSSAYRLFSSWSDAEINSCYGFYIESKKTSEVLALGSCH
jgi:hypothetical protein